MSRRICAALVAVCLMFTASGCAGSLTNWLTNLRNSQGDSAVDHGNLKEAQKEYELALALAPRNHHARAGLAQVLFLQARAHFVASDLDDAEIEVKQALTYGPSDPDTQALASEIEQAKIRRDIVIANYPSYSSVGASIQLSLKSLIASNKAIQKQVAAFGYDYDPAHLTRALELSYAIQDEVTRISQRLLSYRTLVQAGVPRAQAPIESETPNLLPIP